LAFADDDRGVPMAQNKPETAWEPGSVIFHRSAELQASAAVSVWGKRPLAPLVIACWEETGLGGNDVHDACAEFIRWYLAQSPPPRSFSVQSLPGLPWAGADHDPWDWYERLMAEVAGWDPPPVLCDLDEVLVTYRGEVLWPPPELRRARRTDRRARPPGAPFPVGWFGQQLGDYRPDPTDSTYACYPPEELPPIRVPLDGTFRWLRSAPEQDHSVAADRDQTTAALERLLASAPAGLPPEFVAFFRSPDLWRRIRSCTGCFLHLDAAAVGIRGGPGSLVRFLSDSQYCRHWHLYLAPGGTGHAVVATYFYTGSDADDLKGRLPHPKDITTCAASFEEFVYRFWLENELSFALHAGELAAVRDLLPGGPAIAGRMPEGGREYLAFYRPEAQDAEPGAAPDHGGR
jgi:hypothetical protein